MSMHSHFITIEGGEGVGKSTLIEKLAATYRQRQYPLLISKEPTDTLLGVAVRPFLATQQNPKVEFFLHLATRTEHMTKDILPALEKGMLVICDRFFDSTYAYQGALGISDEALAIGETVATCGVRPCCTLYLDARPEIALARIEKRSKRDWFEKAPLSFHERVRARFLTRKRAEPARMHLIDAEKSPEEVLAVAIEQIDATCQQISR